MKHRSAEHAEVIVSTIAYLKPILNQRGEPIPQGVIKRYNLENA